MTRFFIIFLTTTSTDSSPKLSLTNPASAIVLTMSSSTTLARVLPSKLVLLGSVPLSLASIISLQMLIKCFLCIVRVSSRNIKCSVPKSLTQPIISLMTNLGLRRRKLLPNTLVLQNVHLKGQPRTVWIDVIRRRPLFSVPSV